VSQTVNFNNAQSFTITGNSFYAQDVSQETQVDSITQTRQGFAFFETREAFRYPLTANYSLTFATDGSGSQFATVSQEFKSEHLSPFFASFVDNKVNSTDTLDFSPSGITGNSGAQSSQSYKSFDSRGHEYSCTLASENNVLTTVSKGCGSNR
jgi:hypothetical protein